MLKKIKHCWNFSWCPRVVRKEAQDSDISHSEHCSGLWPWINSNINLPWNWYYCWSREVEDNLRIGKSIELVHKIGSKRPFLDLPIENTVSKLHWIENIWKHLIIESIKLLMVWYKFFYKWKLNCKKRATSV